LAAGLHGACYRARAAAGLLAGFEPHQSVKFLSDPIFMLTSRRSWEGVGLFSIPAGFHPNQVLFASAHGRDAADTSFATIFGNAVMCDMNISTELTGESAQAPQYSEQAI
jgi:hypothetical protein